MQVQPAIWLVRRIIFLRIILFRPAFVVFVIGIASA